MPAQNDTFDNVLNGKPLHDDAADEGHERIDEDDKTDEARRSNASKCRDNADSLSVCSVVPFMRCWRENHQKLDTAKRVASEELSS